jgi:hypothetical protein
MAPQRGLDLGVVDVLAPDLIMCWSGPTNAIEPPGSLRPGSPVWCQPRRCRWAVPRQAGCGEQRLDQPVAVLPEPQDAVDTVGADQARKGIGARGDLGPRQKLLAGDERDLPTPGPNVPVEHVAESEPPWHPAVYTDETTIDLPSSDRRS